jgi:hypothetical protein
VKRASVCLYSLCVCLSIYLSICLLYKLKPSETSHTTTTFLVSGMCLVRPMLRNICSCGSILLAALHFRSINLSLDSCLPVDMIFSMLHVFHLEFRVLVFLCEEKSWLVSA